MSNGAEPASDPTNTAARDIADVPAVEVVTTVAVHLMSAAAIKCGLAEDEDTAAEQQDLAEARILITALAGLIKASALISVPRTLDHSAMDSKACKQRFERHPTFLTHQVRGPASSKSGLGGGD